MLTNRTTVKNLNRLRYQDRKAEIKDILYKTTRAEKGNGILMILVRLKFSAESKNANTVRVPYN